MTTPFLNRLKRLVDSNDLAWTLPLPPWAPHRERAVRHLRQVARRGLRRRLVADRGWGAVLVQSAAWPLLAGLKAWLAARAPLPAGGPQRSWIDLWWVQLAHNLRISDQQMLAFALPAQRAHVNLSLPCCEHQVLMDLINRNTGLPEIEDKRGFARFCAQHGLPTIGVLVESDGRQVVQFQPLPAAELFLKPADRGCGEGISTLPFAPAQGGWRGSAGETLPAAAVADYAIRLQAGHPWILQLRRHNSPAWAAFSPGALCTLRVVTGRAAPHAPVELIGSFMRFPRGAAIVDNIACGALSADVDLATGRLGPARDATDAGIDIATHPDTGADIAGVVIPAWDQVRALALQAHAPISRFALIGWDIALLDGAPALVEMNLNWGVFTNTPLGRTRYPEITAAWLGALHP